MKNVLSKNSYPFIVKMEDEILSVDEIETHKRAGAELVRLRDSLANKEMLVNALSHIALFVAFILTVLFFVFHFVQEKKFPTFYFFGAFSALALSAFITSIKNSFTRKINELSHVDVNELNLIENDPDVCGQLNDWIKDYPAVKSYLDKIAEKGRLPTFAEFHCIETWMKQKDHNTNVENLKTALNINVSSSFNPVAGLDAKEVLNLFQKGIDVELTEPLYLIAFTLISRHLRSTTVPTIQSILNDLQGEDSLNAFCTECKRCFLGSH